MNTRALVVCGLGLAIIVLVLRYPRRGSTRDGTIERPRAEAADPKLTRVPDPPASQPQFEEVQRPAAVAAADSSLAGVADVDELLIAMAENWARRDPSAAAAWAAGLPEDANRSEVIASVTAIWAETAPAEAAQFASSLPSGAAQTDGVVAAVSIWGRREPVAAAQWAEHLPMPDLQAKAYERLVLSWIETDALTAVDWLIAQPDSLARDAAIASFCSTIGQRHPALAFTISQSVANEELRDSCLENVTATWAAVDPQAVRRTLAGSGLPPKTVEQLQRVLTADDRAIR